LLVQQDTNSGQNMNTVPNSNEPCIFAVDLGGTHFRAAVVDRFGKIHQRLKQETPKGTTSKSVVDTIVAAAHDLSLHHPFTAASVMVPGTVDVGNAIVLQVPNLPSLNKFALKAALEKELECKVVLENDANAAAVGEQWMGAARGLRNVVCVTLGTGVGGGIIANGELWRGAHGSGGEIGHATVDPFGGLKCKCGGTGCLELFASATAIVRMTEELLPTHPGSGLRMGELTAAKVYEAGLQGDALALKVFATLGDYLGAALANLINLIDPEIIVIGGGVMNGWKLFEANVRHQIRERGVRATASLVKIATAECGDDAGLLGAARLGFDELGVK
jgi:glucokinase